MNQQRPYDQRRPRPAGGDPIYVGTSAALAAWRAGGEVVVEQILLPDGRTAVRVTTLPGGVPAGYFSPAAPRPGAAVQREQQRTLVEYRPHPSSRHYSSSGPARSGMLSTGQKWLVIVAAAVAVVLVLLILLIQAIAWIGAALAGAGTILVGFAALAALLVVAKVFGGGGGGGGGGVNFTGNRIGRVNIRS